MDYSEQSGFFDPLGDFQATQHNLPHWHQDNVFVFITWRLADALPEAALEKIVVERRLWLKMNPQPWTKEQITSHRVLFSARIDNMLDAGAGQCILREPKASAIVSKTIEHFDGERYDLDGYVVMPNHVHVLTKLRSGFELPKLVHSWKSFSSNALASFSSPPGRVWQEDYWDRLVRNAHELSAYRSYIEQNPTRAKLRAEEYALWLRPQVSGPEAHSPVNAFFGTDRS